MKYKYYNLPENIWSGDLKDNYKSRSKIGKKAYKTFLKNGGTRDSKGRFGKKKPSWKDYSYSAWTAYNQAGDVIASGGPKDPIKIAPQKIDWEKIGEDTYRKFYTTRGLFSENKAEHAKAFAKVFQKHGLIKEGVEI